MDIALGNMQMDIVQLLQTANSQVSYVSSTPPSPTKSLPPPLYPSSRSLPAPPQFTYTAVVSPRTCGRW